MTSEIQSSAFTQNYTNTTAHKHSESFGWGSHSSPGWRKAYHFIHNSVDAFSTHVQIINKPTCEFGNLTLMPASSSFYPLFLYLYFSSSPMSVNAQGLHLNLTHNNVDTQRHTQIWHTNQILHLPQPQQQSTSRWATTRISLGWRQAYHAVLSGASASWTKSVCFVTCPDNILHMLLN